MSCGAPPDGLFPVHLPVHLWATVGAVELMHREGESVTLATQKWAQQIAHNNGPGGESWTVPSPGELFYLHVRPRNGAALLYTAAYAQAVGDKSDLSRIEDALFTKLLTRCRQWEPSATGKTV